MMDLLPGMWGEDADREADGSIQGLAVAVVTDNRDPDGLARIRVRLPWQGESGESFWARIAMPMSGNEFGSFFLPEVGDEVLVGFDRGDMSHPFILGSLWSQAIPPPETNADGNNNRRLIRTRSNHELLFDDGDQPTVELKLSDGKHLKLDDQGVVLEDEQGNTLKIESGSGTITIESTMSLNLSAPTIAIEADAQLDIKTDGILTLKGSMVQIN
jgi:uncharacterized protein involved in type VI secretion and phage assembly